jgi:hypothetical protein
MGAIDLKRTVAGYSGTVGRFDLVTIEPRDYLTVDGSGDPNTSARFAEATAALFQVSYALKFASKKDGVDYVVPPLEGLWSADDMEAFTDRRDKGDWRWSLLVHVPAWLDGDAVDRARDVVARKKNRSPLLPDVELRQLDEGLCVQTLYVGAFDDEGPTIAAMHESVAPGHVLRGQHHEIYLSDIRRVAPDRLRTVIRQPVAARGGTA